MRQRKATKKGKIQRDSLKELMVESIQRRRKFTPEDEDLIVRMWNEFNLLGLTDTQIAKEISKKRSWIFSSVQGVIKRLRRNDVIAGNSNQRKSFSEQEIKYIKRRRKELESQGMGDWKAANHIAREKGWKFKSVSNLIRKLIRMGTLQENLNKQKQMNFDEGKVEYIKSRWLELSADSKNEGQISGIIAKEKIWKRGSILSIIERLQKHRQLPENPNKRQRFKDEEVEHIKKKWEKYVRESMNDVEIARKIAADRDWKESSVWKVIQRLHSAGLRENPNRCNRSDDEKLNLIIKRWKELSASGMTDKNISVVIGEENGWISKSVQGIIYRLREKGKIPQNPNKKTNSQWTSNQQLVLGLSQAADAMEQFGDVE